MAEAVHPGVGRLRPAERRAPEDEGETRRRGAGPRGFRLGRVAGVEIRIDWSLAVVFWLIAFNLGAGLLPAQHPQWSPALRWSVAVAAALLFFGSVLAHELAHAIVGRARGVPVEGITLFIFGGVARLGDEPKTAGTEFVMAIVGPLTSLVIAVVCSALGLALGGADGGARDPMALARGLGPAATVLLWLGSVNMALAIFNCLPGFPLDGGRVVRAGLWKATGDLKKATRWASNVGRVLAMLLIFAGVTMALGTRLPWLGGGLVSGLWLVFIGWFLNNAALQSYEQVVIRELLRDVPVARLMRTGVVSVRPDLTMSALVDQYFMRSEQRCFPVVEEERLVGVVCVADVRKVDRDRWDTTPVRAIMTDDLAVVGPDQSVAEAMRVLTSQDIDQLPVVEDGRLVGLLRRTDVLRWIDLHGGRGGAAPREGRGGPPG